MTYEWDFSFLLQYKGLIAIGALYTIGFTIVTAIAGFVVGGLIAVARLADARVVTLPLLPSSRSSAARPCSCSWSGSTTPSQS